MMGVNNQSAVKWRSSCFLSILLLSGGVYAKAQLACTFPKTSTACSAIHNESECETTWSYVGADPENKGNDLYARCEIFEPGGDVAWTCRESGVPPVSCPESASASTKNRGKNKSAPAKRQAPAKEVLKKIKRDHPILLNQKFNVVRLLTRAARILGVIPASDKQAILIRAATVKERTKVQIRLTAPRSTTGFYY